MKLPNDKVQLAYLKRCTILCEAFVAERMESHVCKLKTSMVKQTPRCWNMSIDAHLRRIRFIQVFISLFIHLQRERLL